MGHSLNGCRYSRTCACGARAKDGASQCAKCNARARWTRRKAHRHHGD
jgi:hypothetical protein